MARSTSDKIYSATYSNVPVYEYNISGNHVMRRRSDDWINATHILKVAGYDKPTRTRILEREVQKGIHEKVQGGYGKYQGTWISLEDGRDLAQKNGVLDQLLPIFNFVPGDRTPPPAPKHITAASSKPRAPRAPAQPRRQLAYGQMQPDYERLDTTMRDAATPENVDLFSESGYGDYDNSQHSNARKRRRVEESTSQADKEHRMWAEELLDYFMLQDNPLDSLPTAPSPPTNVDINRPIDDKGHTALHWAAAMGDVEVVKDLIRRGANIDVQSKAGETPLMRAVIFTNSFDRQAMEKLAALLIRTVNMQEWNASSTVFHHIANTTHRKSKYACARYYMECLLNKMVEGLRHDTVEQIMNAVDANGDTAITIAARNGARKCVRCLIGRNAAVDIVNNVGETADQFIVQLNNRRQERLSSIRQLSSSPMPADSHLLGGAVQPPNGLPFKLGLNQASVNGDMKRDMVDVYKSESALTLTSQIIPSFFGKTKALAATLEAQITEKDAEFQEAERLVSMRRRELEDLKVQREELRAKELEQTGGSTDSDEQLVRELEELERQYEELTAEAEDEKLKELLRQEQAKVASQSPGASNGGEMSPSTDDPEQLMKSKLNLARELSDVLRQREQLIKAVVQAASLAGAGDQHEQYRRLLSGCLNLREGDVQGMLPEIIEELQQWRELEVKGA